MRDRLFILTNDPVPFGTANANYIRNFARAVADNDWDVVVIGMRADDNQHDFYQIDGGDEHIQYWNFNYSRKGAKNYLRAYFGYEKKYRLAMEHFGINKRDYIFVYSTELDTAKAVIKTKTVSNSHKSYGEVEWFQPYQYKYGKLNALYILWKFGFKYRAEKFEKAIPISKNLEKWCVKHGCKTLIIPPMVDVNDMCHVENYAENSLVHFIYPGAASDKDSFPCMLKAFQALSDVERKTVRFHLTSSMNADRLKQILSGESSAVDCLKDVLVYHGWMTYEELMNLYGKSDYLLLARAENIVTVSNFPSKIPEMMNYGIVPVCSNVGDYTDLYLKDGLDSIQFAGDDEQDCLRAIRKAIEIKQNGELQGMKQRAKNTAVQKFDYRIWGKKIVEFISC